jgi:DNA-binding response OmpR family regulator
MAKKILLIDDDEDMVEMVSLSLSTRGYDVISATDPKAGIDKAASEKPDLILLDIMMAEIDGFEICNRLKSAEETKNIPIIFFTAIGSRDLEEKCFKAGGSGCIVKPFETEEMMEKIEGVLK